ncbi:hypothetical protein Tco_0256213 [Tanacetum coccineum]
MESVKKSIDERAQHTREYDSWVNERQVQTTEEKDDLSTALDASLVDTESSEIGSKEQDTRSRSGNDAHVDDADLRPIYNEEPMAENAEQCHDTCPLPAKLTDNQTTELSNQSLEFENIFFRQPTAFKSERPRISKPRFASQVDVYNDLSKPVTTHYLPKERESAVVKPHHVIASSESRNSSKNMPRFSSNDMVHNHYLEEAKNKTQDEGRNSKPSVMPSARSQPTANGIKPKPRSNTQTSRNWLASKNRFVTTKTVPIAEHSRNSRKFFDSKHFVCSTCQKCVFNANRDSCVTKFLKEVNSRAKVPSNKTTNRNKPVEQTSFAKKPERQIPKGRRFSIKKTSVVHEKTMTPRSCLWWKPTGKIFKTVCLRWVPSGKIFTSSTTVNPQMVQMTISLTNMNANKLLISVQVYDDGVISSLIPVKVRIFINQCSNSMLSKSIVHIKKLILIFPHHQSASKSNKESSNRGDC